MERIVELAEGSRKDIPPRKLEDKQIHQQCRGIALALINGWRDVEHMAMIGKPMGFDHRSISVQFRS